MRASSAARRFFPSQGGACRHRLPLARAHRSARRDCLIDLAPIAYLNQRYGGKLGVLWVDSHPDVMRPEHFSHAHAHVLGMLMGEGDPDFVGEVKVPVDPARVMYAGLEDWNEVEDQIIRRLQLRYAGADALAETSQPVLDWIATQTITHLAVHFDLDVLDPANFPPLLFNKPGIPEDTLRVSREDGCGWTRWCGCSTMSPEPPMWSASLSPSICPGTCSNSAMRCADSRFSPDQN